MILEPHQKLLQPWVRSRTAIERTLVRSAIHGWAPAGQRSPPSRPRDELSQPASIEMSAPSLRPWDVASGRVRGALAGNPQTDLEAGVETVHPDNPFVHAIHESAVPVEVLDATLTHRFCCCSTKNRPRRTRADTSKICLNLMTCQRAGMRKSHTSCHYGSSSYTGNSTADQDTFTVPRQRKQLRCQSCYPWQRGSRPR